MALRCRIVLAAGAGKSEAAIAAELKVNRKTVRLWRERFLAQGLTSLWEIAPGRGRKATYSSGQVKAVIDATLQSKSQGSTHWRCRLMAASQGMSKSTVGTLWRSHNIKPHRTKAFKPSRDPKFVEKLTDVVGLYLNPPDKAIVLCGPQRRLFLPKMAPVLDYRSALSYCWQAGWAQSGRATGSAGGTSPVPVQHAHGDGSPWRTMSVADGA